MGTGPEGVFETIWAQAAKVLPADSFSIALCGPGPNQITYELVIERGVKQVPQTRELGDGLSDVIIRTAKPLLVRSFELEKGSLPLSWMGAPMIVGGRVLGLVSVQSYRQGAFDQKDLSILSMLSNWAASAIESAQRLRVEKQEAEASAALLQVARALGRETEDSGLFRSVAEIVPSAVECDRCSVWSWASDLREFQPAWRNSFAARKAESFASAPMRPDEIPAVADLLRTTDVVVVSDVESGQLGAVADLVPLEIRSVALVPLAVQGEIVGQVVVVRSRGQEGFSPREVDLLRGLSDIVGLALENQRHHRQAGEAVALRELSELKSRLISTISHELRTPLSFVQAGSELLMQRLFEPEQLRQVAGLVNQGSVRLAEVVDDIIEFADLQSGAVQLSPQPTNLGGLVRDAIADATGVSHGHRVLLHVDEPLPVVSVDGEKLKAVVVRLVRNALNFSQDPAAVLVRLSLEGEKLRIEVTDNGFGIPLEDLERMFDPFFRGEMSQTRCIPGTGLGLSIVKQLVGIMGGQVAVQSQLDKGTAVIISVPVKSTEPAIKPGNGHEPSIELLSGEGPA
ncbi:MAG: sensor histidine kinase [Chloroflexota bacterium]